MKRFIILRYKRNDKAEFTLPFFCSDDFLKCRIEFLKHPKFLEFMNGEIPDKTKVEHEYKRKE